MPVKLQKRVKKIDVRLVKVLFGPVNFKDGYDLAELLREFDCQHKQAWVHARDLQAK